MVVEAAPQPKTPGNDSDVRPEDSVSETGHRGFAAPGTPHNYAQSSIIARSADAMTGPTLSAPSSLGSRKGHSSSTHFSCKKCKYLLPLCAQSLTKRDECAKDVASYKSLSDRWRVVRQLRVWWHSLSPEQQTEWFRKQQSASPGSKRKFDECVYEEAGTASTGDEEREQDHFQPWWLFRDQAKAAGTTLQVIEQNWKDAIDNPESDAIFRRGQWLVPRFAGVFRDKKASNTNSQTTKRLKQPESVENLQDLHANGQKMLKEFFKKHVGARTLVDDSDAPHIDRQGEDVEFVSPPSVIGTAVQREVP